MSNTSGKVAIFHNSNPIHIEVGMGKGQFILALARLNPDINYIGIERYSSVLLRAVEKLEEEVPNLRFICMDAATLPEVFDKNEISRIYLNFSDPWPKARTLSARGIFLNLIIDTFLSLVFRVFARVKAISFVPFLV